MGCRISTRRAASQGGEGDRQDGGFRGEVEVDRGEDRQGR